MVLYRRKSGFTWYLNVIKINLPLLQVFCVTGNKNLLHDNKLCDNIYEKTHGLGIFPPVPDDFQVRKNVE